MILVAVAALTAVAHPNAGHTNKKNFVMCSKFIGFSSSPIFFDGVRAWSTHGFVMIEKIIEKMPERTVLDQKVIKK